MALKLREMSSDERVAPSIWRIHARQRTTLNPLQNPRREKIPFEEDWVGIEPGGWRIITSSAS
jgi:hypothetical protein